MSCMLTLQSFS